MWSTLHGVRLLPCDSRTLNRDVSASRPEVSAGWSWSNSARDSGRIATKAFQAQVGGRPHCRTVANRVFGLELSVHNGQPHVLRPAFRDRISDTGEPMDPPAIPEADALAEAIREVPLPVQVGGRVVLRRAPWPRITSCRQSAWRQCAAEPAPRLLPSSGILLET